MTMFGINILLKHINNNSFIDREVSGALKRRGEKEIFNRFLVSELSSGDKVIDFMLKEVKQNTKNLLKEGIIIPDQVLLDFTISILKAGGSEKLNTYDTIVRKIIEQESPRFKKLHNDIDKGRFDGRLPFGYPDASKRAAGMLTAKIKDTAQDVREDYLEQKFVGDKIREFSKEMFYGINKLDLSGNELVRYLNILYGLSLVQVAPTENPILLKSRICEAIRQKEPIDLVYIKSLRYSYPGGKGMKLVNHLNEEETLNLDGTKRKYFSEHLILERLGKFVQIFNNADVKVHLNIIIADNDLDILFPIGSGFVPDSDIYTAKEDINYYLENFCRTCENMHADVYLLTDFIKQKHLEGSYTKMVKFIYSDVKNQRNIISEREIEERVNFRYEFFGQIYGKKYSRECAREAMYNQIANVMALSEVFNSFKKPPVVVIDYRGLENKMIGGLEPNSRSVFLTKLKEPTIIEKVK